MLNWLKKILTKKSAEPEVHVYKPRYKGKATYKRKYMPALHQKDCACEACIKAKAYRQLYYKANKDAILDYAHQYSRAHRADLNAYMREYHKKRKTEAK